MYHTSGKWEVTETIGTNIKSGDVFIAGIHSQDKRVEGKKVWEDGAYDKSETRANANLIASAPEMLETLYLCRMVLANAKMNDKDLDIHKAWEIVFNTIEKAEAK